MNIFFDQYDDMMNIQKHLRCTIDEPDYEYSALVIHMAWNVDKELNIDPPIHGRYCLSGGPTTFSLVVDGISNCNYFDIL
jgi:hypothetical protein